MAEQLAQDVPPRGRVLNDLLADQHIVRSEEGHRHGPATVSTSTRTTNGLAGRPAARSISATRCVTSRGSGPEHAQRASAPSAKMCASLPTRVTRLASRLMPELFHQRRERDQISRRRERILAHHHGTLHRLHVPVADP
jgi:hypothetical protein